MTPPALSIPRYALDSLLWQAAKQAGAEARSSCEVRAIRGDGPFVLETSRGEVCAAVGDRRRRAVVEVQSPHAVPRWAQVDRREGPLSRAQSGSIDRSVLLRTRILRSAASGGRRRQCLRDGALRPRHVVGAKCLRCIPPWPNAAATGRRSWSPLATAPLIYRTPQPVRDNMMFVGDAAAFIDPFVGDGISIALRSGRLAALDLRAFLGGAGSWIPHWQPTSATTRGSSFLSSRRLLGFAECFRGRHRHVWWPSSYCACPG